MKTQVSFGSTARTVVTMSFAVIALVSLSSRATAQDVTLQNGDSSATVDLSSGDGMNNWSVEVNGQMQNQLKQQWFYYSINGGTAQAINTIGGLNYSVAGNTLNATYQNSELSVNVQYTLSGGTATSGNANLTESISVNNLSGNSFNNLNLYKYSNFNLLGSGNNSVNILTDGNSGFDYVQQTSGSTTLAEAITSPSADFAETGYAPSTLNNILTTKDYQLNDNLSELNGDVGWAFEWSREIDGGDALNDLGEVSLSISQVPEPAPMALIALGTLAFGFVRCVCKRGI